MKITVLFYIIEKITPLNIFRFNLNDLFYINVPFPPPVIYLLKLYIYNKPKLLNEL